MKRDPVCGLRIEPTDALRLEYHGKTYFFCTPACKREFEDRPDEYAEHPAPSLLSGVIYEPIRMLATAVQEADGPSGH